MTTTELLPCPFCGGTNQTAIEGDRTWSHSIMCPCGIDYSGGDDLAGCIAAWNRRASQAAPAPSDALREAVEQIDADLVEQAISDRTSDGATQRQIAKYVVECILAALTPPAKVRSDNDRVRLKPHNDR